MAEYKLNITDIGKDWDVFSLIDWNNNSSDMSQTPSIDGNEYKGSVLDTWLYYYGTAEEDVEWFTAIDNYFPELKIDRSRLLGLLNTPPAIQENDIIIAPARYNQYYDSLYLRWKLYINFEGTLSEVGTATIYIDVNTGLPENGYLAIGSDEPQAM